MVGFSPLVLVWDSSHSDENGNTSLVVGALSLAVLCRLSLVLEGCSFLVVAGGSKIFAWCSQLSICDSSLVVGGTFRFAVGGSSRVFVGNSSVVVVGYSSLAVA